MTTVSRTVTVDRELPVVAAFLSDFATSARWDPHTVSCRRLDDGPLRAGARFENVQRLAGRNSDLVYTVTEYQPERRIVLEGGNRTVHSRDRMDFERAPGGGTAVTYTVDIHLTGLARAATPLLPMVMKKIADQGQAGMRQELEQL
jgi:hypothetical protein